MKKFSNEFVREYNCDVCNGRNIVRSGTAEDPCKSFCKCPDRDSHMKKLPGVVQYLVEIEGTQEQLSPIINKVEQPLAYEVPADPYADIAPAEEEVIQPIEVVTQPTEVVIQVQPKIESVVSEAEKLRDEQAKEYIKQQFTSLVETNKQLKLSLEKANKEIEELKKDLNNNCETIIQLGKENSDLLRDNEVLRKLADNHIKLENISNVDEIVAIRKENSIIESSFVTHLNYLLNSSGSYITPCPCGKQFKVGNPSCLTCENMVSYDLEKKIVDCKGKAIS
jgi:hypothetical protein